MYLGPIQDQKEDAGVRLLAYSLMTNHVHWVMDPEHGDSLAVLFRRVHGRYAQYFNSRYRRSGHLWQGRFFSCPLSESHLDVVLKYVETNPVRAGIVLNPMDYRWSITRALHGLCAQVARRRLLEFARRMRRLDGNAGRANAKFLDHLLFAAPVPSFRTAVWAGGVCG